MLLIKRKNKTIIFLIIIFSFTSCQREAKTMQSNEAFKIDTVYYILSKEASDKFDMLLDNYNPSHIYLHSNSDENNFHFAFFLTKRDVKSEKDDFILEHSNRFLKTKKNVLKIYLDEDECFSISPENKMDYISHAPMAGITVNARGELLDFFSEDYKLK